MHPLIEFAREADNRAVCWRIYCTTCGSFELRGGIRLLARGSQLRGVAWPGTPDAETLGPLTVEEADGLAGVCIDAPLDQIAHAASFPAWLGYLGMILFELTPFLNHRSRIGQAWSHQFLGMGGEARTWVPFERRAMSWGDLEAAEQERLGARD